MPCKVGYPVQPCPFGYTGQVTRAACGACVNFEPPKHILKWCSLYDKERTLCLLPKSHCSACVFKVTRGPGRPRGEGKYDFRNPADRRKYEAEWRAKNPERVKAIRDRFLQAHPDYFKKREGK